MMRIGHGFDVHRFAEGRQLVIGGISIPYHLGLDGHSDADVLLHAISDALLGAAGEGDIGGHFPDTDATYKDADSKVLLSRVVKLIGDKGYTVGNVDSVIITQKPKLADYIPAMRRTVAAILRVSPADVNVKATTTERLGFTGRGEGIAAEAICLLLPLSE
ncbi:MAG: 2-C-methyl-D-erythritol 2,4-cyclodiphosphate synthase [Sporolactobacillus sp.]|nr:2-C-methyl-D-erythritol 2,4-cyclodiphosphate synthase [Sporolactobacillus sp.]